MKIPFRLLFLSLLAFAFADGRSESAPVATKPGYKVMLEVTFDEKGVAEEFKVAQTDDYSGDQVLTQIAIKLAATLKQEPRMKDGKPVKFKALVPFNFPVEDDEGAAANNAPQPRIHNAIRPTYPPNLATAGEVGGAILELIIGADGNVRNVRIMRASHPEFGQAAADAVRLWTFIPALKDGNPVESRWRVAIEFAVDGKSPDWKWRIAPRPALGGGGGNFTVGHNNRPAPAAPAPATSPAPVAPATAVENPPAPGK